MTMYMMVCEKAAVMPCHLEILDGLPGSPVVHHRAIRVYSICRSAALDSVLPSPLSCGGLVARAVGLVDVCDFRHQRVVWVRVCEHGADG